MRFPFLFLAAILFLNSCELKTKPEDAKDKTVQKQQEIKTFEAPEFSLAEANKLLELPLHCVETEYPNKLSQTIGSDADLQSPETLHPIFYGCFDWHSAAHGYWSMVTLLKEHSNLDKGAAAMTILDRNITKENVAKEIVYFEGKLNKSYERTYGWAWLLKLQEALKTWDHPKAREWETALQPLADLIVERYIEFLPKLVYPIRVGEHTNTAFGLTFAYDYAQVAGHTELQLLIEQRAKDFYMKDAGCPITWEPSGYDFLSPCLEELDIMRRVLPRPEFKKWVNDFMPALKSKKFKLPVGEVSDRTDGKLVHLDGLNFSRAWVLYGLANQYPEYNHLKNIAHEHIAYSYPNLVGDSYEGGHWLGSFAIYALIQNQ
ncbi:MAG: hypothetical protein ACI825_000171 [Planctomycetota bacterium]|jgi:hypothetical protein|uniref:DUF2891 domain-containing protein n=1 Tax=Patiriisocius sp. Uisw_047 TaxID=3230969 RepID=UPI0039EA0359